MDIVAARASKAYDPPDASSNPAKRRAMKEFLAALALLSTFFIVSPVAAALTEAELSDVGLHPVAGPRRRPISLSPTMTARLLRSATSRAVAPRSDPRRLQLPYDMRADTRGRRRGNPGFRSRRGPRFQSCRGRHRPARDAGRRRPHEAEQFGDEPAFAPRAFSLWRRAAIRDFPPRSATTRIMTPDAAIRAPDRHARADAGSAHFAPVAGARDQRR